MSADDQRTHLEKLLKTYTRNKNLLESQMASFGGEDTTPVHILNQLDAVRDKIKELQGQLDALGGSSASSGSSSSTSNPSSSSSVVNLGSGNNQSGANISIGDVAGRDIIQIPTIDPEGFSVDLPQFRNLLVNSFNDGELRDLCFDLGIDYDSLPGSNKSDKARELISYAQRRGFLSQLLAACRKARPSVAWPNKPSNSNPTSGFVTTSPQASENNSAPTNNTFESQISTEAKDQPITSSTSRSVPNQVVLLFETKDEGATITWNSSILGRLVTSFAPPYDDNTLPIVIKALDAAQYPNYPLGGPQFTPDEQSVLTSLKLWQNGRILPSVHKLVGQAIYNALDSDGKSALEAIRNYGIAQRQQISYVLRFPQLEVDIAALPWEAMTDNSNKPVLLTRGNNVDSCERYMDINQAIPPPLTRGNVPHILALAPSYNIPDDVRQNERQARLATWDALKEKGLITYDEIGTPLTRRALSDYLRRAERTPDIVHYFGHGVYRDGQGYLLFDDGNGGKSRVSADQLSTILGDVRLMVILACESARIDDDGGLLTGVAPALSIVTGAVVAMQLTTRITAATRFAEVFYDELLSRKKSLQDAVAEGRQTLYFEEDDGASWYVPTIYIRSQQQEPVYILR